MARIYPQTHQFQQLKHSRPLTLWSSISAARPTCTDTTSNPLPTPRHNSHSAPRQHAPFSSTNAFKVIVILDKSAAADSRRFTSRSVIRHIRCHCSMRTLSLARTRLWVDVSAPYRKRAAGKEHLSLSSKSLGIVISSTLSIRFVVDSSSIDIGVCFRQSSKEGSLRKTERSPSSLITGWFLYIHCQRG